MYYSITFGEGNSTKNTWSDWNLIPESPPTIALPQPKTNYVDIPGRTKGPIDMSTVPFGHLTYERMTGSWAFVIRDDYWYDADRVLTFNTIRSWLHGKSTWVVLEEDPTHKFYGRFALVTPGSGQGLTEIQITYDLEPVRYNLDGTVDSTWLPQ